MLLRIIEKISVLSTFRSELKLSGTLGKSSQMLPGGALRSCREELSGGALRCSRVELSGGALRHSQEEFSRALSNVADDHHVAKPPSIRACTLPCHQIISILIVEGGAGGRGVAIQYVFQGVRRALSECMQAFRTATPREGILSTTIPTASRRDRVRETL